MSNIEKHTPTPVNYNPQIDRTHINAGAMTIEETRAIAQVQAQVVMAKKFPRNLAQVYQDVMDACSQKIVAEKAMYAYPRGGETIKGASIHLAREIARIYGNIMTDVVELSQKDGQSEMCAYAWDMQTNRIDRKTFVVKHERHTKKGVQALTDPRDIYELDANLGSRRQRAALLAIIPPDLVEAAIQKCHETLAGKSSEPLSSRVNKMVTAFAKMYVTVEHIEKRLGKKLSEVLIDDFVELQGIYTSIKDGMTKASDWFGVKDAGENTALEALKTKSDNVPPTE